MTSDEMENVNGDIVTQQISETKNHIAREKAKKRHRKPRNKRVPKPSGAQQQESSPESPQEEEEVGHNVFVGNLPFNINEEELLEYFSQAGHVLKANIIKRWNRSLGFGFVTFDSKETADNAVGMLDKSTFAERVINVEATKPRSERTPRPEPTRRGSRQPRGKGRRQPRSPRTTDGEEDAENATAVEANVEVTKVNVEEEQTAEVHDEREPNQRGRVRRNKQNRKRRAAPPKELPSEETANEARESELTETPQPKDRVRKPRARKPRTSNGDETRQRRPRRPRGPPSNTVLFIANLPFNMNDTGLEELFKDFKISSAHVITRKGTDRNKGYGFVEAVDHSEQQRVLQTLETGGPLHVDGRDLSVKVALEQNHEDVAVKVEQERREPARIDSE